MASVIPKQLSVAHSDECVIAILDTLIDPFITFVEFDTQLPQLLTNGQIGIGQAQLWQQQMPLIESRIIHQVVLKTTVLCAFGQKRSPASSRSRKSGRSKTRNDPELLFVSFIEAVCRIRLSKRC